MRPSYATLYVRLLLLKEATQFAEVYISSDVCDCNVGGGGRFQKLFRSITGCSPTAAALFKLKKQWAEESPSSFLLLCDSRRNGIFWSLRMVNN